MAGGHLGIAIGAVALVAAAVIGRRGGALIDDSPMGDVPFIPADFGDLTTDRGSSRGGEAARTAAGRRFAQAINRTHGKRVNTR